MDQNRNKSNGPPYGSSNYRSVLPSMEKQEDKFNPQRPSHIGMNFLFCFSGHTRHKACRGSVLSCRGLFQVASQNQKEKKNFVPGTFVYVPSFFIIFCPSFLFIILLINFVPPYFSSLVSSLLSNFVPP